MATRSFFILTQFLRACNPKIKKICAFPKKCRALAARGHSVYSTGNKSFLLCSKNVRSSQITEK